MAKDPAVLWYWADWHSGTTTLSRFLKGCYMDLLHAQFNNGRLSISEIKTVLGVDFGQAWPTLQKKFKQDEAGLFFNERAEIEKSKREKFVKSRRNNLKSSHMKSHMDEHMVNHMGTHMDNVNVNRNESGSVLEGGMGETLEPVIGEPFLIKPDLPLPSLTLEAAEMNQFALKGNKNTEFLKLQWMVFVGERIHDPPEIRRNYRQLSDLTTYFLNWVRNKHPNATNQGPSTGGSSTKPGTSEARIKRAKDWGRT